MVEGTKTNAVVLTGRYLLDFSRTGKKREKEEKTAKFRLTDFAVAYFLSRQTPSWVLQRGLE